METLDFGPLYGDAKIAGFSFSKWPVGYEETGKIVLSEWAV